MNGDALKKYIGYIARVEYACNGDCRFHGLHKILSVGNGCLQLECYPREETDDGQIMIIDLHNVCRISLWSPESMQGNSSP